MHLFPQGFAILNRTEGFSHSFCSAKTFEPWQKSC
jgi:hypothetical protein